MKAIEEEIKNIIESVTERKYISELKVSQDNDIWTLYLYLNRTLVPMVMSVQGDEKRFKEFVIDEIKKRRLQEVKYWQTNRELPSIDCETTN